MIRYGELAQITADGSTGYRVNNLFEACYYFVPLFALAQKERLCATDHGGMSERVRVGYRLLGPHWSEPRQHPARHFPPKLVVIRLNRKGSLADGTNGAPEMKDAFKAHNFPQVEMLLSR
jgi:hypothetical protein